ncbi:cilia- and flagella-associated protein 157 [Fundulus heteroclitus]|uniref:cilia- and flagella-associated protein 157 n=1 Tax=Fundulus heteroclitus TaxID=8078 RepID=UPI00165AD635|nr:cilia- and flagella-associated protein 157 [Fundulus heteroclitus]
MPRKKERKSGENENKLNPASPKTKAGIDDKEKRAYVMQIGFLNEELERFQIKCDQLEKQNKSLIAQYSTLDAEKKDITEYLKRSVSEREEELQELQERLETDQQASAQERHALQLESSHLSQELQELQDRIQKNATLAQRLADLEELQRQKDDLMSTVENLEKQLERQREQHKDELHSLEMKVLLEKRRLEEEMESEVAAMLAKVEHLVELKLPERTRCVLQENTQLKVRFSQLCEVARSLQEENASLREHQRRLRIDTEILEQTVRQTARISCRRRKEALQLTGRLQQLQEDVQGKQQQLEELQEENTRVLAQMEALRPDRVALSAERSRNQLEAKLKEERRRRNRMKSIMQEAANTLRLALKEAPAETQEADPVPRWRRTLQNLQDLLDPQTLSCCSADRGSEPREQSLDPGWASRVQPSRGSGLGAKASLCRAGAASCSSLVPLHRKPTTQKSRSSANLSLSSVGFLTAKPSGHNFLQINPKNTRKEFIIEEKYI